MKTECDSEQGETRDADATAGAAAGAMELSKEPEKKDQGKQGQEAGGGEYQVRFPLANTQPLSHTAHFIMPKDVAF
jgi:hypothetical protein